jgi:hypothetical protein
MRTASLMLLTLSLMFMAAVAEAQVIYNDGPINGNVDAWTINFGFIVSDTFNVPFSGDGATISGASFGMWLLPGDTLSTAEVSITSQENGGMVYYDQVDNFTQSGCVMNQFGFNVCTESTNFSGPTLNQGTYWINLQNATVPSGDPVYWDENSGPSAASQNSVGSIPSEAFTISASCECRTTTTTTTTSVPEPSSIMLFGSAILGLASWAGRKLL